MYRVDVLPSARHLDAAAWDRLVGLAGASVFYRHRVLVGYEESRLAGQRACAYVAVRGEDGAQVAGVPLYLMDGREILTILGVDAPPGAAEHALLSHFPHCYDTTAPVLPGAVGLGELWSVVLAEARRRGAALCGFMNVAEGTPAARELAAATGVRPVSCGSRWYLEPAAYGRLDGLLGAMARPTRRTLRLAVRRAADSGAVIDQRQGAGQDLTDVVALCQATAAKHGNNYYPPGPLHQFLTALGDRLLILRVRRGGETIAASACLVDGSVLHCWAGGVRNSKVDNWSPNHVLFHAELALAFDLGAARAEFGRRSDDFKARHRLTRAPLLAFLREV
jgi:predicted N-acyltransferase